MLMRVVAAITFDKAPDRRVMMLAECLNQNIRREIPALMRTRRPSRRRSTR